MVRKAISNIGKLLTKQQTEIMAVASILIIISIVTKAFGLLFNSVALGYVGTGAFNTFLFAANLPELISQIILLGAISASVLPILSGVLENDGKKSFQKVFSSIINISLIIFTSMAVIIAATAHEILPWFIENIIRPENEISPDQLKEIVSMLRVLMIPQVILGVSIYLSTALNIYERFLVPQLAPLFYNIGRIAAIYILYPFFGQDPWILVWGTIFGALLHLFIQIPLLRHIGIGYEFVVDIGNKYIQKIGVVAMPRIMSISVEQIGITIDKFIAFGLVGDSLALYTSAVLIIAVPLSIFGTSFSTASFPALAKAFNSNNTIIAGQIFRRILNQILFLSIPAAFLLLILRVPVARLAFGIFGEDIDFIKTYTIAWVILFFAPGIIFESLRTLLYKTFYATHDTVRPLLISLFVMAGGVVTGILFTNYFSHFNTFDWQQVLNFEWSYFFTREAGISAVAGLALSSTLVFTLEGIILIAWVNRKYLRLKFKDLWLPVVKKIVAGLIMAIFTYFLFRIWASLSNTQYTFWLIILTGTTTAAGLMVYLGVSWLLRIDEVGAYLDFFKKYPRLHVLNNFLRFDPIPDED